VQRQGRKAAKNGDRKGKEQAGDQPASSSDKQQQASTEYIKKQHFFYLRRSKHDFANP
jgi:hypothetical protein